MKKKNFILIILGLNFHFNCIIIFITLSSKLAFAQTFLEDTSRINFHLSKADDFFTIFPNIDSIKWHSQKGIEIGKRINYHHKDATLYRYLGICSYFKRELDSAEYYYQESIKSSIKSNDYLGLAKGLQNIGGVSYERGNFEEALDYFLGAIKVNSDLNNYSGLSSSLVNTARVYQALGDQEKVHEYVLKCIDILPYLEKEPNAKDQVYGLASEYFIRQSNVDSTLIDSAFIYIYSGYQMVQENEMTNRLGFYQNFMGAYYFQQRNYDSAAYFIGESLAKKKYLSSINLGNGFLVMAQIEMKKDNITLALDYMDSIQNMTNYLVGDVFIPFHNVYYQIYKRGKNFEQALYHYEKEKFYRDSISTKEKINTILELETKYKSEIKDAEITQLNQKRKILELETENQSARITWLSVIVVISLLIVILIFVLYRQSKIKNEIELIQSEQRLNRSRINPHFLNNAFTGIQAMALEPDSEEKLISFTGGVSRYSRLLLESTLHDEWSLQNEFELIQQFTAIYLQKFKDRYQVNIENPTFNLKETQVQIPAAITQTMLENAFEHSSSNEKIAEINISFHREENKIVIKIENTFGESQLLNKRKDNEQAQGLIIAQNRISLYNKKHKKNALFKQFRNEKYFTTTLEFN